MSVRLPPAKYAWYAKSFSASHASIRLRCLRPIAELRREGWDVETFRRPNRDDYSAVVFSKAFDRPALRLAEEFRRTGRTVMFDLCDNLFHGSGAHVARLEAMLELATSVVVSTPTLGAQLQDRFPGLVERFTAIPEPIDVAFRDGPTTMGLVERISLLRLRRFLASQSEALHCIWFGNSAGIDLSGLSHLAKLRPLLEDASRGRPITLTIVSDSHARFRKFRAGWNIPLFYLPWRLGSIDQVLAMHDVAVIPVDHNPYTVGKTMNRPAKAIALGLGVIADAIPSYEELRPFIVLDNWEEGLAHYAALVPHSDPRLVSARQHLAENYSIERIGAMWAGALAGASQHIFAEVGVPGDLA